MIDIDKAIAENEERINRIMEEHYERMARIDKEVAEMHERVNKMLAGENENE